MPKYGEHRCLSTSIGFALLPFTTMSYQIPYLAYGNPNHSTLSGCCSLVSLIISTSVIDQFTNPSFSCEWVQCSDSHAKYLIQSPSYSFVHPMKLITCLPLQLLPTVNLVSPSLDIIKNDSLIPISQRFITIVRCNHSY